MRSILMWDSQQPSQWTVAFLESRFWDIWASVHWRCRGPAGPTRCEVVSLRWRQPRLICQLPAWRRGHACHTAQPMCLSGAPPAVFNRRKSPGSDRETARSRVIHGTQVAVSGRRHPLGYNDPTWSAVHYRRSRVSDGTVCRLTLPQLQTRTVFRNPFKTYLFSRSFPS